MKKNTPLPDKFFLIGLEHISGEVIMWVTTDNIFIVDNQPNSDGHMYIHRPCPNCLGSGINCQVCSGIGSLPPALEKVYPVYEWAALHGLKLPFNQSVEQTCLKKHLVERLAFVEQDKGDFYSSIYASLNKSKFPTRLQYRYILPAADKTKPSGGRLVMPFNAKLGVTISVTLFVKHIDVFTRKFSTEKFSSLLMETPEHRHFILYDTYPSQYKIGDVIDAKIYTTKRLWINNMSILQVKLLSISDVKSSSSVNQSDNAY